MRSGSQEYPIIPPSLPFDKRQLRQRRCLSWGNPCPVTKTTQDEGTVAFPLWPPCQRDIGNLPTHRATFRLSCEVHRAYNPTPLGLFQADCFSAVGGPNSITYTLRATRWCPVFRLFPATFAVASAARRLYSN